MNFIVTVVVVFGCRTVSSSASRHSDTFSVVFSPGTQLLVDDNKETTDEGSSDGPSIQILKSTQRSQDPESGHLLVCLLKGLKSPWEHVLWWLNDTLVTSAGAKGPWKRSKWGYSATLVWEVSSSDWRPTSSYWCGTIQDGREYREKLCSEN